MAKIKQGILGGFSGKVANVVGTSWKGRAVMKSQPLSVSNPRTEAQQEQRGKFSKIAELASLVLTQFVQPVENPISGDISGYNKFCKDNKSAFDGAGDIVAANLCAGGGKIINLESPSASAGAGDDYVALSWTNSAGLSAIRQTDKVYAFAIEEETGKVFVANGMSKRAVELTNLNALQEGDTLTAGNKVAVVFACVSADGRDVSVKTFAIEETVA